MARTDWIRIAEDYLGRGAATGSVAVVLEDWAEAYGAYLSATKDAMQYETDPEHIKAHLWWWTLTRAMAAAREAAQLPKPGSKGRDKALEQLRARGTFGKLIGDRDPGLRDLFHFAEIEAYRVIGIPSSPGQERAWLRGSCGQKVRHWLNSQDGRGHDSDSLMRELQKETVNKILQAALGESSRFNLPKILSSKPHGVRADPVRVFVVSGRGPLLKDAWETVRRRWERSGEADATLASFDEAHGRIQSTPGARAPSHAPRERGPYDQVIRSADITVYFSEQELAALEAGRTALLGTLENAIEQMRHGKPGAHGDAGHRFGELRRLLEYVASCRAEVDGQFIGDLSGYLRSLPEVNTQAAVRRTVAQTETAFERAFGDALALSGETARARLRNVRARLTFAALGTHGVEAFWLLTADERIRLVDFANGREVGQVSTGVDDSRGVSEDVDFLLGTAMVQWMLSRGGVSAKWLYGLFGLDQAVSRLIAYGPLWTHQPETARHLAAIRPRLRSIMSSTCGTRDTASSEHDWSPSVEQLRSLVCLVFQLESLYASSLDWHELSDRIRATRGVLDEANRLVHLVPQAEGCVPVLQRFIPSAGDLTEMTGRAPNATKQEAFEFAERLRELRNRGDGHFFGLKDSNLFRVRKANPASADPLMKLARGAHDPIDPVAAVLAETRALAREYADVKQFLELIAKSGDAS